MNRKSGTEDRDRCTRSSKISSLGPGLYQAVMYPDIVHFKNKTTGELQEINNSLVAVLDKLEGEVVYESIIPGVDKTALPILCASWTALPLRRCLAFSR